MALQLSGDSIQQYSERMTTPESPVLAALNRETNLKVDAPVMLSGQLQGAALTMISQMIRPSCVLEIGTYTGYSAICLAQGLAPGGVLHTIDINEELEEMCIRYWRQAGVRDRIRNHIGEAAGVIPKLDETFDLVFIDADKINYHLYYDLVFDKVRPGGFILADNVLYKGEVAGPAEDQSKNAKALHAFNEKIRVDERVSQVLLPVRDGLLLITKNNG